MEGIRRDTDDEGADGDVLLDLSLSNQEKLLGKVKAGSSWCCTHHEVVKFRITRGNTAKKKKREQSPGI